MADTDEPIRWGIAATGGIADQMTRALHTLPDAEVVAVGSRRQQSADAFAARHGIPRAHGSYADLYADADIDIVYVASPHSGHHEMTIDALRAGRHVLCEKAFAINAAQAQEMIDTARVQSRFLMEAMWSWFMPAWAELRRRIENDEIGTVRLVDATFGIPVFDENSRLRRPDLAGGALLDLGIYPLALARWAKASILSTAYTCPMGPTTWAMTAAWYPEPPPTSRTLWPSWARMASTMMATMWGADIVWLWPMSRGWSA